MKKISLILGFLLAISVIILSFYSLSRPKKIIVQGMAKADEYRVSSKVPGRIDTLSAKKGDKVQEGDVLATLSAPEIVAKVLQAKSGVEIAGAQEEKALRGAQPEEKEAVLSLWQKSIVAEKIAYQTLNRVKKLFEEGVSTAQQYDEAIARYDASVKDRKAAKAKYDLVMSGARVEDKQAAVALTSKAEGALLEAESYLNETILVAPISGEVSAVTVKRGELTGSGVPVMTIVDINNIYFSFNVREDLLPYFQIGETFEVTIPAINSNCFLEVFYIATKGDYSSFSATRTGGGFDLKTFEVNAIPKCGFENLRPGVSAIYSLDQP